MNSIKLKLSLYKILLDNVGNLLIISVFGFGLAIIVVEDIRNNVLNAYTWLSIFCFFLFSFLLILIIIGIVVNSKSITFTIEGIYLGSKFYPLHDIENIKLSGKKNFGHKLLFDRRESTTITFKSGIVKTIFHDLYSNYQLGNSFLEQIMENRNKSIVLPEPNLINDYLDVQEIEEVYKNNMLFNFSGIMIIAIIGFIIYRLVFEFDIHTNLQSGIIIVFGSVLLIHFIRFLHYFSITENYFVVRHHILFWKYKAYRIDQIREIVFESQRKSPINIRLITKDFRFKVYYAGSLFNNTWVRLYNDLEKKGILLRDEAFLIKKNK